MPSISRSKAVQLISSAISGKVEIDGWQLVLEPEGTEYFTETTQRDRWESDLHLQIPGKPRPSYPTPLELLTEDNALRGVVPAFDGVNDLCGVLGLNDSRTSMQRPTIELRVKAPLDLLFAESKLDENRVDLAFIKHKKVPASKVVVATRAFPGDKLKTRLQIGKKIKWGPSKEDQFSTGRIELELTNADSLLVMVTFGEHLVRRQWLIDPARAPNVRFVAMQLFDKDLRQLRGSLLETTESRKFEDAVRALLFLHGFSPSPVLETQAPDILVESPHGSVVLVECTTRLSDFSAKMGKLVDRRQALLSHLQSVGISRKVHSILVSPQPRSQIAADLKRCAEFGVLLLTRENLEAGLMRSRLPSDPEGLLTEAIQQLAVGQQEASQLLQ